MIDTPLRQKVYAAIDVFQDMVGWQPGESRNALVVDIRNSVEDIFSEHDTANKTSTPHPALADVDALMPTWTREQLEAAYRNMVIDLDDTIASLKKCRGELVEAVKQRDALAWQELKPDTHWENGFEIGAWVPGVSRWWNWRNWTDPRSLDHFIAQGYTHFRHMNPPKISE